MKLAKISLVAAILLGGLVAMSNLAVAQDAGTNNANKKGKRPTLEQRMEQMDKELKLTDAQKPKVKALFEETGKKMQEVRNAPQDERRGKMKEVMDEQNKKMKEILTADQYKKYEEMNARMHGGKGGGKKGDTAPSTTK